MKFLIGYKSRLFRTYVFHMHLSLFSSHFILMIMFSFSECIDYVSFFQLKFLNVWKQFYLPFIIILFDPISNFLFQINQLEKDKDVVAQAQAIFMLEKLPQLSFAVVNALNSFLSDSKVFFFFRNSLQIKTH